MPALLIRMSIVPNAATKSANILATAALFDTSATKDLALPPARSISVTTFCADSGLMSLTPTFAPSRAKVSPISRPSPEPPRVGPRRFRLRHHALLHIEHAQICMCENIFGLLRDIFLRQLDRGVEVALGLVAHDHSVRRVGVLRIDRERLLVQLDRFVEFVVGECVDRL